MAEANSELDGFWLFEGLEPEPYGLLPLVNLSAKGGPTSTKYVDRIGSYQWYLNDETATILVPGMPAESFFWPGGKLQQDRGVIIYDVNHMKMAGIPFLASMALGSNDVETKPPNFENLPRDVQNLIVRKTNVLTFACLKQCSKNLKTICEESGHLPDYRVRLLQQNMMCTVQLPRRGAHWSKFMTFWRIPPGACTVRLENCSLPMTEFSESDDVFKGRKVVIDNLYIEKDITCEVEKLVQFIKSHKVKKVQIGSGPSERIRFDQIDEFLKHATIRNQLAILVIWLGNEEHPSGLQEVIALSHLDFQLFLPSISVDTIRHYLRTWPTNRHPFSHIQADRLVDFEYDVTKAFADVVEHIRVQVFGGVEHVIITYRQPCKEMFLGLSVGNPTETAVRVAFIRETGRAIGVRLH